MYGADWCPDCAVAKAWLDKKGFTYSYHDIETSGRSELETVAPGIQSIPVIVIDTAVLIDPSLSELAAALQYQP